MSDSYIDDCEAKDARIKELEETLGKRQWEEQLRPAFERQGLLDRVKELEALNEDGVARIMSDAARIKELEKDLAEERKIWPQDRGALWAQRRIKELEATVRTYEDLTWPAHMAQKAELEVALEELNQWRDEAIEFQSEQATRIAELEAWKAKVTDEWGSVATPYEKDFLKAERVVEAMRRIARGEILGPMSFARRTLADYDKEGEA